MEKKKLVKEQLKLPDGSIQFYFINPSEKVASSDMGSRKLFVGPFFMSQLDYNEKVGVIYHELGHLHKFSYLLKFLQLLIFIFAVLIFSGLFFQVTHRIFWGFVMVFTILLLNWFEEFFCDYYAFRKVGKVYLNVLRKIKLKVPSSKSSLLTHPPINIRILFLNFF